MKTVTVKMQEYKITLQDKFVLLNEEEEELNDNLTTANTECARAVGEERYKEQTGKLTQKTKELITERKNMKGSSNADQTALAELSKLINL